MKIVDTLDQSFFLSKVITTLVSSLVVVSLLAIPALAKPKDNPNKREYEVIYPADPKLVKHIRKYLEKQQRGAAFAQGGSSTTSNQSSGSGLVIELEHLTRQNIDERLQTIGVGLLGDNIDLNTGTLSFEHVDVSVSGNSSLAVEVRRSRSQGYPFYSSASAMFADWQLETPRITMLTETGFTAFCGPSNPGPMVVIQPGQDPWTDPEGSNIIEGYEYSNGLKLHVPGAGSQNLLDSPQGHAWPSGTIKVTKDHWAIKCGPSTNSAEGLIATAPNGTVYKFDFYATRDAKDLQIGQTLVPRTYSNLYASEVEDVYGNWVKYDYNPGGKVQRIYSNDGREITFTYGSHGISTAKVENTDTPDRVWTYGYSTIPGNTNHHLTSMTQPDSRSWSFSLQNLWQIENPTHNCVKPDQTVSLTHPTGVTGTFVLGEEKHAHGYSVVVVPPMAGCGSAQEEEVDYYKSYSVQTKTLVGPGYPSATWNYNYSELGGGWGEVTDPLGRRSRTTYVQNTSSNHTLEKLPLKSEQFDGPALTPMNAVTYSYEVEEPLGTTWLDNENHDNFTRPRHQIKTVTLRNGDIFTTETDYNTDQTASDYSYSHPTEIRSWSDYYISDASNKRITETDYAHYTSKWVLGNPTQITQNGRLISQYGYHTNGLKVWENRYGKRIADFDHFSATEAPDAIGAIKSIKDANNRWTYAANYKRGRPQLITRNDNSTISSTVNDNGWITSQTDTKNDTTSYQYDTMGRLKRITPHTPPAGTYKLVDTIITYAFGASSTIQTIKKGPRHDIITYDGLYRPVLTQTYNLSNGERTYVNMAYNALNEVTFQSFPSFSATSTAGTDTEYDALGRVIETIETVAPNAKTKYRYLSDHRYAVTDPLNNDIVTYRYGYDGPDAGDSFLIRQPENIDTWTYRNVHGEITRARQKGPKPGGGTVDESQYYYYDTDRRLCRYRTPEAGDTLYAYDAAGQLTSYAKGQSAASNACDAPSGNAKVTLTYDTMGRLEDTLFTDPATPDIFRTYDVRGNLLTLNRGTGQDLANWLYTYDDYDRLKKEELTVGSSSTGFDTTYRYNAFGYLFGKWLPSGRYVAYTNDGLGRNTRVTTTGTHLANNVNYHPSGQVDSLDFGNGQEFSQTLNARLMPYTLKVSKNGTYVQDMEYLYDANGRVEHQKNLLNTADTRHYLYDGAGRLERATAAQWGQADYSYDGLGNLRAKSFTDWNGSLRTVTNSYNTENQISASHDTNNILYGFNYDARGNVTLTGGLSFTYDMSDQPIAMSGTAPNTGTSVTACSKVETIDAAF